MSKLETIRTYNFNYELSFALNAMIRMKLSQSRDIKHLQSLSITQQFL